MIENRFRLEKLILLGRQAVRRAQRKEIPRAVSRSSDRAPAPGDDMGVKASTPPTGFPHIARGSPNLGTDGETSFTHQVFLHDSPSTSPSETAPPIGGQINVPDIL